MTGVDTHQVSTGSKLASTMPEYLEKGRRRIVSTSFNSRNSYIARISGLTDKIKASSGVALRYSSLNDFESS